MPAPSVVVFGLRGNVYRSDDGGATWAKVDAGLPASIVGATRTAEGATLLADVGGRVASSSDGGTHLRQGRAHATDAAHGHRRCRRRQGRARRTARRRRFRARLALTRALSQDD